MQDFLILGNQKLKHEIAGCLNKQKQGGFI